METHRPRPAPKVTVAIATCNRAALLGETLAGVTRQQYPPEDFEILVIDNNSVDNTRSVVESFATARPSPRYVREQRQGLSFARNRAITEARGEIIVFADDDILAEPDWLSMLVEPFTVPDNRRIGAVGGEVIPVFPGGLPAWLEGRHNPLALRPNPGPLPDHQFPMGANLAVRRSVFAEVGVFNEQLGRQGGKLLGGEETEFLKRVRAIGLEIWFAPKARVLHQLPASRTTFVFTARHAFDSARSRVIERAGQPGATGYLLSRLPGNVLKALGFGLLAVLGFLILRTGPAKKFLVRAWRSCGYLYQIPRSLMGKA